MSCRPRLILPTWACFPPDASVESRTTQQRAHSGWAIPPAGLSLGLESQAVLKEEATVAGPGPSSWRTVGRQLQIPKSRHRVSLQCLPTFFILTTLCLT